MTMPGVVRLRRDTAFTWTARNPVLELGEPGYERDTGRLKIGDGVTAWRRLPYFTGAPISPATGSTMSDAALLDHINALRPHPTYDDGPSLVLLYQNAKV